MASADPSDGAEDVNDFLRRIKELGDQRDKEDAERTRKLENDILEGRKQREARRAERARSLSPEKATLRSPQSFRSPMSQLSADVADTSSSSASLPAHVSTVDTNSSKEIDVRNSLPSAAEPKPEQRKQNESSPPQVPPKPPSTASAGLSRSGTLSWQNRATAGSLRGPRSRPTSTIVRNTESLDITADTSTVSSDDTAISRNKIAENLSSKDPSWFRQTPDRGIGSAAYRRGGDEADTSTRSLPGKRALHGMSRESTPVEDEAISFSSGMRSRSPSQRPSTSDSYTGPATSSFTSTSAGSHNSPKSSVSRLDNQNVPILTPTQGSIDATPEDLKKSSGSSLGRGFSRPESPTKGAGGFVQSAMLKRSDSVSKRWTAPTNSGSPTRQNSSPTRRRHGTFAEPSASPDSSLEPSSRPSSSHSSTTVKNLNGEEDNTSVSNSDFARPNLPSNRRSQHSNHGRGESQSKTEEFRPPSPTKRWSPVKSSWLESALNKPESPKVKASPEKPQWMTALSRNKEQRASRDVQSETQDANSQVDNPEASKRATMAPSLRPKPPSLSKKEPVTPTKPELTKPSDKDALAPATSYYSETSASQEPQDMNSNNKPVASPKRDMQPRSKLSENSNAKESGEKLEFQNAFGKLRRTQTKNYVAPDELKNNILIGKSALNNTGGPQKSARRDELKESLIERKESMKAKVAESGSTLNQRKQPIETANVPEAIAKKRGLGGQGSGGVVSAFQTEDEPEESTGKSSVLQREEPTEARADLSASESTEPAPLQKVQSSKLADRFNPGLAGMLARGRPPQSSPDDVIKVNDSTSNPADSTIKRQATDSPAQGGQLQHVTKTRARGPKRRAPNNSNNTPKQPSPPKSTTIGETSKTETLDKTSKPVPPTKSRNVTPSAAQTSSHTSTKPPSPKPKESVTSLESSQLIQNSSHDEKAKGPKWGKISQQVTDSKSPPLPSKPSKLLDRNVSSPSSTKEAALTSSTTPSSTTFEDEKPVSRQQYVKDTTGLGGRRSGPTLSHTEDPISPPTRKDEDALHQEAGLNRPEEGKSNGVGLGLSTKPPPINKASKPRLQLGNNSSLATDRLVNSSDAPDPPNAQKPGAIEILKRFFDKWPVEKPKMDVDTTAILETDNVPMSSKIKTLRKQISEIGSDGKTPSVPSHQEHVLFSNKMYVCTHIFGDATGARITEVYLWGGSRVADSSFEDAQLFARKIAKENNGKLIPFRQGKESANFFQALGGIVITRGSMTDNSTPYMLCGRQHLGHLAFDEISFSAESLCSGFPFIVCSNLGNIYLWKGGGCNTEELSGARLISMDLGPSGEVIEIDEGQEPNDFLDVFPGNSKLPISADHWKHKPRCDNYRARLFQVDYNDEPRPISRGSAAATAVWNFVRRGSQPAEMPSQTCTQVTEIMPFSQNDLESENIYVLDAFFEIYIILGPLAHEKPQAFACALIFAQEYAILAASSENRPRVPFSTIVMEGTPKDMKAVFRTWDDTFTPTSALMAGKPRSGQSLTVFPLNDAISAMRA